MALIAMSKWEFGWKGLAGAEFSGSTLYDCLEEVRAYHAQISARFRCWLNSSIFGGRMDLIGVRVDVLYVLTAERSMRG